MTALLSSTLRVLRDNRGFVLFLLGLALFRTAVADWNPIPSGSMRPTLLEGDVVLVNRLAYDAKIPLTDLSLARLADPRRGDVVTFSSPRDGTRLIKRIVAVGGDSVELRDNRLLINGQAAIYRDAQRRQEPLAPGVVVPALQVTESVQGHERLVQLLALPAAPRSFGPLEVPADHVFVMGDNRDNSGDSRVFGAVPRRLLIGRAHHVMVSVDFGGHWQPRLERLAAPIR